MLIKKSLFLLFVAGLFSYNALAVQTHDVNVSQAQGKTVAVELGDQLKLTANENISLFEVTKSQYEQCSFFW